MDQRQIEERVDGTEKEILERNDFGDARAHLQKKLLFRRGK